MGNVITHIIIVVDPAFGITMVTFTANVIGDYTIIDKLSFVILLLVNNLFIFLNHHFSIREENFIDFYS